MKLQILLSTFLLCASNAVAQLNGDGYYRIQNYYTERYLYVMDNRGSIDLATTSADMGAVVLSSEADRQISDPSCVLHITKVDSKYDLAAMGTSVHGIIGYYLEIKTGTGTSGTTTYFCDANESGMSVRLCDGDKSDYYTESALATNAKSGTIRNWLITPISSADDTYFGIKPDVEVDGKYYKTFYVSFPFKLVSSGMKAYVVRGVENDEAQLAEIDFGRVIPAATPVLIECSSSSPSSNRIEVVDESATSLGTNALTGNYFCYYDVYNKKHANRTAYDSSTMRLLGKTSSGKLGFIKSTEEYLPQNCGYLTVATTAADEIPFADEIAGISAVTLDSVSPSGGIYTLQGVKVSDDANATDNLPRGIYIIGGKKVVVK